jgi:hypothetical protein
LSSRSPENLRSLRREQAITAQAATKALRKADTVTQRNVHEAFGTVFEVYEGSKGVNITGRLRCEGLAAAFENAPIVEADADPFDAVLKVAAGA